MAAQSFPEFHVTGPVHHYVRVPGDSAYYYLGTAEVTPKVKIQPFYGDVFNDIGGRQVPMQRTEQGEIGVIGALLNRYSKTALDVMLRVGPSVGRGWRNRASRGSLVFGRSSFELWQVFENYFIPGYASTNLEPGYYWPQCTIGPHDRDTLGTDAEKLMVVVEAYPVWLPQASHTAVVGNERSWKLYSTALADFPNDVRVPQ